MDEVFMQASPCHHGGEMRAFAWLLPVRRPIDICGAGSSSWDVTFTCCNDEMFDYEVDQSRGAIAYRCACGRRKEISERSVRHMQAVNDYDRRCDPFRPERVAFRQGCWIGVAP